MVSVWADVRKKRALQMSYSQDHYIADVLTRLQDQVEAQADEIARLRAENQEAWNKLELSEERERKLRAALEAIKANPALAWSVARRALEPKP